MSDSVGKLLGSIAPSQERASLFLERHGIVLLSIAAFLIPLKLLAAYIVIIPLLSLWLFARLPKPQLSPILTPFLLYAAIAFVSSFFGLDPSRALRGLLSLVFFSLLVGYSSEVFGKPKGYYPLFFLLLAQAIAAFQGAVFSAYPDFIHQLFPKMERLFLGRIAESGQMALSLVLAFGLFLLLAKREKMRSPWPLLTLPKAGIGIEIVAALFACLLFASLGFSFNLGIAGTQKLLLLGVACLWIALSFGRSVAIFRSGEVARAWRAFLCSFVIPAISVGALVNLKRGPWVGIAVASVILLLRYERKLVLPLLAAALLAATLISPVRARLAQSSHDFFIYGGRNVIWQVGAELAPRYPLGVGYKNSRVLREYSQQIPAELTHFHNNALNILVESGWMALLAFAWWIIRIVRTGFKKEIYAGVLGTSVACAVISWQVAGLVEYNAGDSEVLLVVYLALGLLVAIGKMAQDGRNAVSQNIGQALG